MVPKALRHFVLVLHSTLLLAGGALAISGVVVAAQRYHEEVVANGSSWWKFSGWYVLSHGGTGLALLLLTAAYAAALFRRPLRAITPLIYLLSYGICGLAFGVVLMSVGKADYWDDAMYPVVMGGLTLILPSVSLATLGLFWATRRVKSGAST